MKPVLVMPYDPQWPRTFEIFRQVYLRSLGEVALAVEHVGSRSVPGLAAKPIIDIDVVVRSPEAASTAASRLAQLGYRHEGDLGVPGRDAFTRDGSEDVPRDGSGRGWPDHHLYVCSADSRELRRHLVFRNWLRADPRAARDYGALKAALAERHRHDRDGYTEAKTAFIERALESAATSP